MNLFKKIFRREKKKEKDINLEVNDNTEKEIWKMCFKASLEQGIEAIKNGKADDLNLVGTISPSEDIEEEEIVETTLTYEEQMALIEKLKTMLQEIQHEDSITNQSEYSESSTTLKR